MKLHYFKILLFSLLLNILVLASYENNKNKPYVTLYARTITLRVLSECDIKTSIYDNDEDMKSLKENFDRQMSQRFEEYKEHMIEKRKKCKEQCDKDIQKIILKDKIEKSLEEKMEKGCLRCGCGLGVVAASIGLLGTAVVNELKRAAMAAAIETAIAGSEAQGAAAAHTAGLAKFIAGLKAWSIDKLGIGSLESFFTEAPFTQFSKLPNVIHQEYQTICGLTSSGSKPFCNNIATNLNLLAPPSGTYVRTESIIAEKLNKVVIQATEAAETAAEITTGKITAGAIKTNTAAVDSIYASCHTAIIGSVVAILIIVLVMVIIYLILRYRRKKRMNKKLQYTKLLNQ
ncbi:rifin [Plasmodium sp. gorilla clade G1]|nr:rifin [Plasmodium sp. gorilla clade G1]